MKVQDLVIIRHFTAPRKSLWRAWTEPEQQSRWWGPQGFTTPVSKLDLRVGGGYLNCMRSPDGDEFCNTGIYREIVPFERIVCSDCFADHEGNVVPASYYGLEEDFPLELEVTVSFKEEDGGTKMTLREVGLPPEIIEDCRAGWNDAFDKLIKVLAGRKPELH